MVVLVLGMRHHTPKRSKEILPFTLLFLISTKSELLYQRVLSYSSGTNYWVSLLCIYLITSTNMSTEIFSLKSCQLKMVAQK